MGKTTVSQYYAEDHDRLDAILLRYQSLRGEPEAAKQAFREFSQGLRRHIVWEEDILFPVFETKTGMRETGPTAVMRMEHRMIRAALESIHERVRRGDTNTARQERALLEVLKGHNDKEEAVLYPAIDSLLGEEERAEIFRRMESLPEAACGGCCESPGAS